MVSLVTWPAALVLRAGTGTKSGHVTGRGTGGMHEAPFMAPEASKRKGRPLADPYLRIVKSLGLY